MIRARVHLAGIARDSQLYATRCDKTRLGFNEYVPHIETAAFEAIIRSITPTAASAYPEVLPAYRALSKCIRQPVDRLVLCNGADAGIMMIMSAFCDPGDVVGVVSPTYGMYAVYAGLLNCELREAHYDSAGTVREEDLLRLIEPRTKVVAIANPNGMTGTCLPEASLQKVLTAACRNGTLVILDEAYADFSGVDFSGLIDDYDNLAVLRSFSKSLGMAGFRIGYSLSSEAARDAIIKFKPNVEINAVAASALTYFCTHPDVAERSVAAIVAARTAFTARMRELGFDVPDSVANFVRVDFGNARESVLKALEDGCIEVKLLPPPFERYVRITIGTDEVMGPVARVIQETAKKA